jgi:uncharacterized protein
MKFGLDNLTRQKIQSVFEKYNEIEETVIYGSRAMGNHREGSDIDLTLKGEKLNPKTLSSIEQDIDELNTPYLFDISIFHLLNSPSLIDHINRVGKVFYTRKVKA